MDAVSALGEPRRRALYDHVVSTGDWVSRDQAAEAVGAERGTAAHHLDRLAADGLLEVEYRRLSGKEGPGAGRPSKLYRRSPLEIEVSLPPRRYTLAAELLAGAVDRSITDGTPVAASLDSQAADEGNRLGDEIVRRVERNGATTVDERRDAVVEVLAEYGFEPFVEDGVVVLRNCPFHQVAQQYTDLICGMNLSLLDSALERVGDTGLEARLNPGPDRCCVEFHLAGERGELTEFAGAAADLQGRPDAEERAAGHEPW